MSSKGTPFTSCYLFSGLTEAEKEAAIAILSPKVKHFSSGECILSSAQNMPCLCFIESGRVSVSSCSNGGSVLLTQHKEGDCVGAASLFSQGKQYPTVVKAIGRVTALIIGEDALESLLSINAKVALNHIRYLSGKIRFLNDKIDSFSGRDGESRLAKYLLANSNEEGVFTPPVSMTKIAASLDISRASLYRLLDQMEKNHLIENTSGAIRIIDTFTLERIANSK
jgi:CRP-like cAMP-binding protein